MYVRAYVRLCVTPFLGNRSLLFSEALQLVRAFKREQNVPSAFLIIFTVLAILAKNWSKLAIWLDMWGYVEESLLGLEITEKTESRCF